jgi:hypothetical protein
VYGVGCICMKCERECEHGPNGAGFHAQSLRLRMYIIFMFMTFMYLVHVSCQPRNILYSKTHEEEQKNGR